MKYVIDITTINNRPENWTSKEQWPAPGLYMIKGDDSLYNVTRYSVEYVSFSDPFVAMPFKDPGESVSQSLLLKLVAAAASRTDLLNKGQE